MWNERSSANKESVMSLRDKISSIVGMGDTFLRGQILLLLTTGNAGPSFDINDYPTQNESEEGMAHEDWDICCLFNAISSVPGTQKILNKHLGNKPKMNEVRSVKGLAIRDTIVKKCVSQGEMPK